MFTGALLAQKTVVVSRCSLCFRCSSALQCVLVCICFYLCHSWLLWSWSQSKTIDKESLTRFCQNLVVQRQREKKMKIEFSQTVMRWMNKISCNLVGGWRIQMITSRHQNGKRLQKVLCGCVVGTGGINPTWRVQIWGLL